MKCVLMAAALQSSLISSVPSALFIAELLHSKTTDYLAQLVCLNMLPVVSLPVHGMIKSLLQVQCSEEVYSRTFKVKKTHIL